MAEGFTTCACGRVGTVPNPYTGAPLPVVLRALRAGTVLQSTGATLIEPARTLHQPCALGADRRETWRLPIQALAEELSPQDASIVRAVGAVSRWKGVPLPLPYTDDRVQVTCLIRLDDGVIPYIVWVVNAHDETRTPLPPVSYVAENYDPTHRDDLVALFRRDPHVARALLAPVGRGVFSDGSLVFLGDHAAAALAAIADTR